VDKQEPTRAYRAGDCVQKRTCLCLFVCSFGGGLNSILIQNHVSFLVQARLSSQQQIVTIIIHEKHFQKFHLPAENTFQGFSLQISDFLKERKIRQAIKKESPNFY